MTITGDNLKIQAIYRLEKDRITKKDRLTIAHFGKPENARPTGFKPVKGDDNILVVRVLEREKKKQPPAPPTAPGGVVGSFFRTSPQDAEKFFPGAN
jgi:hypothetical protein